jgi:predicted Zn-dependent protease
MRRLQAAPAALLACAMLGAPLNTPAESQSTSRNTPSGFNLFSVEQDVEIGRQAAVEVEKQLPLLNDRVINRYLNQIVQRLAAVAPGERYPYSVKAVNATEINAFALPGGPMYVHRGLITAARSEAELAGVLAHELSHVALRHGTQQASKAYLGQAGLGLLGGLLGRNTSSRQILNAIGGLGLNAAFLKFSRSDEYEADATGARIMAQAGYDPVAMATMFEMLRRENGRDPSKLEQFFSSHPAPANREARIRQLASTLSVAGRSDIGNLAVMQGRLGSVVAAPPIGRQETSAGDVAIGTRGNVQVTVAAPSARFTRFAQPNGFFTIDFPDNWRA